jgi:superfamily II DNA/RNA helicase
VQTIMFSATMPNKIQELAKSLLHNPVEVKIAVSKPAEKINQSAYVCYEAQKLGIIRSLSRNNMLKRTIIFSGSKSKVKEIYQDLLRMKINVGAMHSDLTQAERDDVMYNFKCGKLDVLVATDIVARGIDIDDITMVINYDVPHDAEDYVHRIGRTARADKDGSAITLISAKDIEDFMKIEHFLGKKVTKNPLPQELGEGPKYERAKRQSFKGRHNSGHNYKRNKNQNKNQNNKPTNNNNNNKN